MELQHKSNLSYMQNIQEKIKAASSKVAPVWPLKNYVAVNPYQGFASLSFEKTSRIMQKVAGSSMTMPLSYYLKQIDNGVIMNEDIEKALEKNHVRDLTANAFVTRIEKETSEEDLNHGLYPTVSDVSEELTNRGWNRIIVNNISSWASGYFDSFQSTWNASDKNSSPYLSWRNETLLDLSFRVFKLHSFKSVLKELPENPTEVIAYVLDQLKIDEEESETYLTRLLYNTIGWSSYVAGVDWNNKLYTQESSLLESFLAIHCAWEYGLFASLREQGILNEWKNLKNEGQTSTEDRTKNNWFKIILQEAFDLSYQRKLIEKFNTKAQDEVKTERPDYQAMFCIDVRSEVFRRHLENVSAETETMGYAGFFGFPIQYLPIGHEAGNNQCPVLIPSGPVVKETLNNAKLDKRVQKSRQTKTQFIKAFKAFKSGPISSFGFVSPMGLTFLPKLVGDAMGWTRPATDPKKNSVSGKAIQERGVDLSGISLADKINMAAGAIHSMGFHGRFAQLILIAGHGSSSTNNPHAAGLDCGACGGHSGEANALTAAEIFNDPEVRKGLVEKGIRIPSDTLFIAGLHDTTTDKVTVLRENAIPASHKEQYMVFKEILDKAGYGTRLERSSRLSIDQAKDLKTFVKRSKDWAQVRPEWGLAGCSSFIIADRNHSKGIDLEGKSFLHNYNHDKDPEYRVLESIMTAPMVVTSWINLQYFASTVDPDHFGAGNKTLHNVTSGIGVLEGAGGDLRIGLPIQSVHNGTSFEHTPYRLSVVIQAPLSAINGILEKHESVRNLCDNGWIHLLQLNDEGKIVKRYQKEYQWEELSMEQQLIPTRKTQKELIHI